jgi:hypothetical protein
MAAIQMAGASGTDDDGIEAVICHRLSSAWFCIDERQTDQPALPILFKSGNGTLSPGLGCVKRGIAGGMASVHGIGGVAFPRACRAVNAIVHGRI